MNSSNQQPIQQSLDQSQQTLQMQEKIDGFISAVTPQIQTLLILSVLVMVAVVLIAFMNMLYKWRVERAILRMDKNLEKLVAAQVPVETEEKKETKESSEKTE